MIRKFFVAALFAAALLTFGCTKQERSAHSAAPDFTLQDIDGKAVSLAQHKGKVVLLDFWATWCPPCRASIPAIERLHKLYGAEGLVVLGISLDDGGWDSVKSFVAEYGISYPVLKGTEDVASHYMIRSIPTLILVNRDGVMAKQYMGFGNDEALEREIKALL